MATENKKSRLTTMPESDAVEKLEQKSNSEVAKEPRVPEEVTLDGKCIKIESSDNSNDEKFEFVDLRIPIKKERSEGNQFPNVASENDVSEVESDSKHVVQINAENIKGEVSDSITNADIETEVIHLKAETATGGQDMKVETEAVAITDNELDSTRAGESATEAAAKLQPENAGTTPKEAVQPSNQYNAEFNRWVHSELQKETETVAGKKQKKCELTVALDEDIRRRRKLNVLKRANQKRLRETPETAASSQLANSLFQGVLPADKQYRCTTCCRGFQLRADLLIHTIMEHAVDDRLGCPICNKSCFSNRGSLFRHIRDHTAEHSVQCSLCSKSFKRKETYMLHMRTHTGELPFQCDTCGKCFYHKGLLIQHLRTHNGEHSFKCATCGKTFVCKGELSKHARIHSGIRPHKCDICGKGFLRKEMLADHTRLHTGARPFACPICGKCFPGKGYLQKHNLVHTGERRHMCSVCSARFARKGHLMRHMSVHSCERPYRCDLCDKTFQHKHQVTRHLVMHDENAFQCSVCDKAFRKKFLLNRHLKIHALKKRQS